MIPTTYQMLQFPSDSLVHQTFTPHQLVLLCIPSILHLATSNKSVMCILCTLDIATKLKASLLPLILLHPF